VGFLGFFADEDEGLARNEHKLCAQRQDVGEEGFPGWGVFQAPTTNALPALPCLIFWILSQPACIDNSDVCWPTNGGNPFSGSPLPFGPLFDPHPGGQWAVLLNRVPRY